MSDTSLLRINDACQVTGLSRNTLYRKMKDGSLSYTEKDGVRWVKVSSLKAFMQSDNCNSDISLGITNDNSELVSALHGLTQAINKLCDIVTSSDTACDSVTVTNKSNVTSPIAQNDTGLVGKNLRESQENEKKVFSLLDSYVSRDMKMPLQKVLAKEIGMSVETFRKYQKKWEKINK